MPATDSFSRPLVGRQGARRRLEVEGDRRLEPATKKSLRAARNLQPTDSILRRPITSSPDSTYDQKERTGG